MKITTQTIFTQPIVVYDTADKSPPSGLPKLIKNIMKPVVQVKTDDGRVLYKTGEFYHPYGLDILLLIGIGLIGYLGYKAVK
jgi:hypothetical protein